MFESMVPLSVKLSFYFLKNWHLAELLIQETV